MIKDKKVTLKAAAMMNSRRDMIMKLKKIIIGQHEERKGEEESKDYG